MQARLKEVNLKQGGNKDQIIVKPSVRSACVCVLSLQHGHVWNHPTDYSQMGASPNEERLLEHEFGPNLQALVP